MTNSPWTLEVRPSALGLSALRHEAPQRLQPDQVLVHIDHLALTANTMTYAALGASFGYWSLFPASEPGWGRIPAWGHGRVVESRAEGVDPGLRLFGLFAMSTGGVLTVRRSRLGLRETSQHRLALNPVYNQYAAASETDEAALENRAAFHPLFIMSFVLAQYLDEMRCFGADTVAVVSASSKTALGLAHLLMATPRHHSLIGLTSERNLAWVKSCELFDRCLSYDSVAELGQSGRCVVIDFSGNGEIVRRIRGVLGPRCIRVVRTGGTHGGAMDLASHADAAHELFSAPVHIERRVKEWGAQAFDSRLRQALLGFLGTHGMRYTRQYADGADAMADAYRDLQRGLLPASTLSIARPHGDRSAQQ